MIEKRESPITPLSPYMRLRDLEDINEAQSQNAGIDRLRI